MEQWKTSVSLRAFGTQFLGMKGVIFDLVLEQCNQTVICANKFIAIGKKWELPAAQGTELTLTARGSQTCKQNHVFWRMGF
jgi:hypothetical protein